MSLMAIRVPFAFQVFVKKKSVFWGFSYLCLFSSFALFFRFYINKQKRGRHI